MENNRVVLSGKRPILFLLCMVMGLCSVNLYASVDGPAATQQANKNVSGTVVDNAGIPLIGVSVAVKGTTNGTVTNLDGEYSLNVPDNGILVFTYVGFQPQEIVVGNQSVISINMMEDTQTLDEIVVVGYGTQKKVNLTGAVSTVKGDVINERTFNNSTNALQGLAPGLTIIDKGGEPGQEGSRINIRGIGTLGKSDPLILVDNVPVNSMNDVLPQDIESVSVLKDAASAAIYGSRAANGVILITTKRGDDKRVSVNYNYTYSLQNPTRLPKSVDARTYMNIINEAYENKGLNPRYSQEYIKNTLSGTDPYNYPWTDWLDFIFQNGAQHNHSLSVSGGSAKNTYRLSLNYLDQDGVMANVNNKRYSVRLNNDYQLHEKLKVSADLSFIRNDNTKPYKADDTYWMYYSDLMWTTTPYNPDGTYTHLSSRGNPAANIYGSGYKDQTKNNFMGSFAADWEVIKNLHVRGRFSAYIDNTEQKEYQNEYTFRDYNTGSQVAKWDNQLKEIRKGHTNIDKTLTVDYKRAMGDHEISGILGYQETVDNLTDINASRKYFAYNDLQELNLGDLTTRENEGKSEKWVLKSMFGRVNYNFKERYLLEANFRYDGSSRFAKGHRWGFFPSFSAGWRLSEEAFMKDISFVDNLKLRGSWGKLGNQKIDLYQYYQTVDFYEERYAFGGNMVNAAAMKKLANEYITWETSTITNVGVDADLLNGKLSVSGEYFYKRTDDILLNLDIPYLVGLDAPTQNIGSVENKGWEIALTHRNKVGDISYSVTANLSDVKNKILDLGGIEPQIVYSEYLRGVGYSMNTIWGYEYMGLMTQKDFDEGYPVVNTAAVVGSPKYRDRNGDGVLNDEDKTQIGTAMPRYQYGLNLNVGYKGFYVDAFFQGVIKNQMICGGGIKDGAFWGGFIWEEWADRYHPTNNPNGQYPIVLWQSSGPSNATSDFWVQNSAYLRMKNLQVGYNIPASFLQKLGVAQCRVYLSGTNLFTITNCVYDPEIGAFDFDRYDTVSRGNHYPQTKTFSAGIDITF